MAVNIHITIIELNALHTKRQNLFQELDAVIHLLMERSEERFSRNAETDLVCRLLLEKKKPGDAGEVHDDDPDVQPAHTVQDSEVTVERALAATVASAVAS